MTPLTLLEIDYTGEPVEPLPLPDVARMACATCASIYRTTGYVRPWIAYLAERGGQIVGTCAFKTPPRDGRVEIAYFTFPDYEGQGIATEMARQLIQRARATDAHVRITAQTLPAENASTRVLRRHGFTRVGTAIDDEAGEVWEWQLAAPRPPLVRPTSDGPTFAVVGDVYRFLATGAETNGTYALWEAIVPPGGGPPPHVHSREEEGFYVLDGEITFYLGDERRVATAGMFANLPIGVPHSFRNESARSARMLISVAPAGLEQMFFEVGMPLAAGSTTAAPPTPEDIERLLAAAPRYGIAIEHPPT